MDKKLMKTGQDEITWLLGRRTVLTSLQRAAVEIFSFCDSAHFTAGGARGDFEGLLGWSCYKTFDEYREYYVPLFQQGLEISVSKKAELTPLKGFTEHFRLIADLNNNFSRSYFKSEKNVLAIKNACLALANALQEVQTIIYQDLVDKYRATGVEISDDEA